MAMRKKVPFEYKGSQDFQSKLVEWVGDVLYDLLPEHGYEVRDEQIFTAFQIADAVCEKKVHLAEAGLGTGKTFAYLLSAIAYARYIGKPVVIACATTALQEQLAGPDGDVNKLSHLLDLDVDARMAKDPNQYICDIRATENELMVSEEVSEWLGKTRYGVRSEMPTISDEAWSEIKWEEYLACDVCSCRGFCKMVRAREAYREASDLIIVDHETFFHDLWTRSMRLDEGKLPILPDYAAVVFDEGHGVLLPAAMKAGKYIHPKEILKMSQDIEKIEGARESLALVASQLEDVSTLFFEALEESIVPSEGSERLGIKKSDQLLKAASLFHSTLDQLLLEMQIEQELYTESLSTMQMQAYEGEIEKATWVLGQFTRNKGEDTIAWIDASNRHFWVVPRHIDKMLDKHLIQKKLPVIFTSATLSHNGDFSYFSQTFGLKNISKSSIGSPFELEEQVKITFVNPLDKINQLIECLKRNNGSALVLTRSLEEVRRIREELSGMALPFEVLYEDQGDRGYTVRQFKEKTSSVLIGADFWEGIDVPGEALTMVVIWDLPLHVDDPLIEAQRKEASEKGLNPVETVDYPHMALKLKQGCGRLIRRETDYGELVILDEVIGKPWEAFVKGALPHQTITVK